jgi:hypothetical protein
MKQDYQPAGMSVQMMPLLATAQQVVTSQTGEGPCVEAAGASIAALC